MCCPAFISGQACIGCFPIGDTEEEKTVKKYATSSGQLRFQYHPYKLVAQDSGLPAGSAWFIEEQGHGYALKVHPKGITDPDNCVTLCTFTDLCDWPGLTVSAAHSAARVSVAFADRGVDIIEPWRRVEQSMSLCRGDRLKVVLDGMDNGQGGVGSARVVFELKGVTRQPQPVEDSACLFYAPDELVVIYAQSQPHFLSSCL
ncbi:hypothetical protein PENSPDRAFT_443712 [Peniophora sp. CONT]|nr:hypothetical protein PENSPDRAFT_443712 [Peniophora sp. CONT]